ncbi:hypothetical protein PR048_002200 [Dryococelus australis]|uniref:Gag-like protein n=1 Tax=Dryococelus australis TaxID=614101 RepID=A0ABQ9IJI4_9NEOP|nr:hypothetical protein PR048_002200 [Dryococelus australis]
MAGGQSTKQKSSDPDLEERHRVRTAAGRADSDLSGMAHQSDKQEVITGRLFPAHNPGSYVVFVESIEGNIGNLHPMSLARKLHPNKEVLYIQRAGPNRLKITFSTWQAANSFISLLCRQGIIYGVPLDYTIKDIQEGFECPNSQVIEIIRMTKTSPTIGSNYFKVIYKMSLKVQTVVQCYNCYRFGHTTKLCRSKDPRCPSCAQTHDKTMCPNQQTPHCYNCSGPHAAIDRAKCPQ